MMRRWPRWMKRAGDGGGPGTAQVSVTWDGQRYDCSVTVTPANVTPAAEDDFKHVPYR